MTLNQFQLADVKKRADYNDPVISFCNDDGTKWFFASKVAAGRNVRDWKVEDEAGNVVETFTI